MKIQKTEKSFFQVSYNEIKQISDENKKTDENNELVSQASDENVILADITDTKIDTKEAKITENNSINEEISDIQSISKSEAEKIMYISDDIPINSNSAVEENDVNYEKIYNELSAIKTCKDYDINGDGKVTYSDINALYDLIQHDPTEIFSDSLKITKTRKDEIQYKAFEDEYTQKAKSAFESIIKEITSNITKDAANKCKSNNECDKLQLSDFLELYNDISNLPEDCLKKINIQTLLTYYKNSFKNSTSFANASELEQIQLQEILEDLTSTDSELFKNNKSLFNQLKGTADIVSKNTNKDIECINEISSQLFNGDIPINESITFSLGDQKVTIENKNGVYIYRIKVKHMAADGQVFYDELNLTDAQIDNVLSCFKVNANGSISSNKNSQYNSSVSQDVKNLLNATEVFCRNSYNTTKDWHNVLENTFTNEFGETSTMYFRGCEVCAASGAVAVNNFLLANNIRKLLEEAKKKDT